ncbi:MAG: hypothetical protein J6X59_04100 [Bacteroidales bacterium]|nr:hypothetical protein [Bacteroidales bacterium]
MKKLSLIILCAVSTLFFASCQTGDSKDKNGDTPSAVVEKMYQAIKDKDFDKAASFNKLPDTVKIEKKNIYKDFQIDSLYQTDKDGKVIVPNEDWKTFLIGKMKAQSEEYTLDSWEIVDEEVSNTDPNSAKVKTKIKFTTKKGQQETECSFPMKREGNVWKIIG